MLWWRLWVDKQWWVLSYQTLQKSGGSGDDDEKLFHQLSDEGNLGALRSLEGLKQTHMNINDLSENLSLRRDGRCRQNQRFKKQWKSVMMKERKRSRYQTPGNQCNPSNLIKLPHGAADEIPRYPLSALADQKHNYPPFISGTWISSLIKGIVWTNQTKAQRDVLVCVYFIEAALYLLFKFIRVLFLLITHCV